MNIPALASILFACPPAIGSAGFDLLPRMPRRCLLRPLRLRIRCLLGLGSWCSRGRALRPLLSLQRLGAENPNLRGLAHELGITYYKAGDYLKAIDALKKATQEDPQDKEARAVAWVVELSGRAPGGCDSAAREGAGLVSAGECRCVVHSGRLLYPDQGLSEGAGGVCAHVRRAGRFGGGLPVHGADAVAAGVRSDCRGVCAEGD